jgi:hypothetical protein
MTLQYIRGEDVIELVDLGVIVTLLGKIGWDERRRSNNGGNGKNGKNGKLGKLEASVEGLMRRMDSMAEEAKASRVVRNDLFSRIAENGKSISRIEGRLE